MIDGENDDIDDGTNVGTLDCKLDWNLWDILET